MYKIKETIVVEGVYDKIKLSRFIDAVIIVTNGFRVFSDERILKSIRKMAEETGIVILTDSDSAGFKIRNYIKQSIPEKQVKHAYVPDVRGKEKRKSEPGKEGLLGVEGIKDDIILSALQNAGCSIDGSTQTPKAGRAITKADLYKAGLSGGANSHEKRSALAAALGIPMKISANMLLDILNRLLDYDEFCEIVQNLDKEMG
ncbi:MAG: toprim domain-containing protein [Hominilimicola sp.]